jgi:DNA topoisomerase-3
MSVHDVVTAVGAEIKTKKTTPPTHFTEGTLIEAMSNIHRYIDDVSAKAKLKETSGIGTEATRANIIETLFKRDFLEKKGKSVISTQAGRNLVKALPDDLTNPVTTALWETALSDIAEGKSDLSSFEQKIREHVKIQINLAVVAGIPNNRTSQQPNKTNTSFKTATCPVCGKTARQLESKNKTGVFYWACENKEHGLMADEKGKPGKQFPAR